MYSVLHRMYKIENKLSETLIEGVTTCIPKSGKLQYDLKN